MILSICMSGKNAVGDSFKNIMNAMPEREKMICVIPEGYGIAEFSSKFAQIIPDTISHAKRRIVKAVLFAVKLREIIKKNRIKNVFIYFDNHWFNVIFIFFLFALNVKVSLWVHDPKIHLGANRKDRFIRWMNARFLFCKIDCFIVAYQFAVNELAENYGIGKEKVKVIYLPCMTEIQFEDIKRKKVNVEYDFIFFGRIEAYKGLDILIKAAEKMPTIKLLIVGTGKYISIIEKQIMVCKNITLINRYVSDQELVMYIKKSKWAVLPYKIATGSQTVQIANYYGVPVVATKTGCFAEYVKENVNGVFVEKYDYNALADTMNLALGKNIDGSEMQRYLEQTFSVDKISNILFKLLECE